MRRITLFPFSALYFLGMAVAPALAQHQDHEAHQTIHWVPREVLERPVPLRQGIGNDHEKVTTSSPQAQAFYDQGLAYLHSYVWVEAARSFHQALRLDPMLAMAYVGLCDTYVALADVPGARAALEKAQSFAAKVTEPERQRIEIRGRLIEFLEDPQAFPKFLAYRKAIYDALVANPADPGLWTLRGFADEGPGAARGQSGDVDSIAFYETALALSPDNSAAHHYLTHSFENIGQTEEALKHSEAYLRLAPLIPHAHHMRGHELRRAGRIEEAILEFRKADELESAYYRSEHISPEYDWHHPHNLSLLAMCYQFLGQMKAAEQLLREAFTLPAHSELAEFSRREWPEFLLHRGRAREALEASQALVKSPWGMGRFAGHTLVGRALLAMNRIEEAKRELDLAEHEVGQIPNAERLVPYAEILRAELLLREKKWAEGAALMKQVEERIRATPSPDARSQALFQLESIARIARQAGDWELAEFTAREMIQLEPTYAGGYYALALVVEHRGDGAMARQEFATAEKLWNKADPDLPELERVRQRLAGRPLGQDVEATISEPAEEESKGVNFSEKDRRNRSSEEEKPEPQQILRKLDLPQPQRIEVAYDPARLRGSATAPVIIVEFSDFQCPYCHKVQPTLKNLLAKYEDKVSLAYRDFPLRDIHPQAQLAAEASRCAGEQRKFWEYHDLLFANHDKLNQEGLVEDARSLKLDEKQFDSCLSSSKYKAQIEQDLQEGMRAGVHGTPGFFINGIFLRGAQAQAVFERIIETELSVPQSKQAAH
jgi:protein-disulfide isomerase/Flp pilus assembly protein TadD